MGKRGGIRGRPSLAQTDYSKINYFKVIGTEKEKLLLDLLHKSATGLTIKEIKNKFTSDPVAIKRLLKKLKEENKVIGPYHNIYFHKQWVDKHNKNKGLY